MIRRKYIDAFRKLETPFYFYDMDLLVRTLQEYSSELSKRGYKAHYALKANADPRILSMVRSMGFGADCVSGNEVRLAVESGFPSDKIVYAGVGKTDKEIIYALKADIFCFNCESLPELAVIDALAGKCRKKARVSLRINPDIDAHTHSYISTGRKEDKFGISEYAFDEVFALLEKSANIEFAGLHFHVGSQITDMNVFRELCSKVDNVVGLFENRGFQVQNINMGGGLGVDYENPEIFPVPDFREYFSTIARNLRSAKGRTVHFEPGRALVAQCGHLISRVLYVKHGQTRNFAVIDAGMNDLIRPALYGASHKIENITSTGDYLEYDVVGPVCESSDRFGSSVSLRETDRGDIIAIHSAGAYGQVMAMRYNQRKIAETYYSDLI